MPRNRSRSLSPQRWRGKSHERKRKRQKRRRSSSLSRSRSPNDRRSRRRSRSRSRSDRRRKSRSHDWDKKKSSRRRQSQSRNRGRESSQRREHRSDKCKHFRRDMKSERLDEFDASRNHDRGKRVHIGEEKTRDIIVTTPSPKPAIPHKLRQMVDFFQIHGIENGARLIEILQNTQENDPAMAFLTEGDRFYPLFCSAVRPVIREQVSATVAKNMSSLAKVYAEQGYENGEKMLRFLRRAKADDADFSFLRGNQYAVFKIFSAKDVKSGKKKEAPRAAATSDHEPRIATSAVSS